MSGLDELPELTPHGLAQIQKFYDTGGWTETRCRRIAPILDALDARLAAEAVAAAVPLRAAA